MRCTPSICTLLLVLLCAAPAWAQQPPAATSDPEREIIIEFAPGMVSLPAGRTRAAVDEVAFKDPALRSVLNRFNAEGLARAFPDFRPADTLAVSRTGEAVELPDLSRVFKIVLPSGANINEAVNELAKLPGVLFAERNGGVAMQVLPNDPDFDNPSSPGSGGTQWNLLNTGQNFGTPDADIDANEAWDLTQGSTNTVIGIIDSGVLASHADLSGKVSGVATSDIHGTHVAGIAAAKTNNGTGIAGWIGTPGSSTR